MIRHLHREQFIRADPARVWEFFATPRNLNELTPPNLRFRIMSDLPDRMTAGQIIEYKISPLPGVWLRWVTEIREVRDGIAFVDEQRAGPYKLWSHEHRFHAEPGGVRMVDRVTYELGWGPFGWLAEKLWVRRQLEHVFDYRFRRVDELFNRA
ncbi:MAG: SRPBCC family protein [bacterium]|nr:SRPBCC family protein [bacterium]MDI1337202.1 SRPBCC family protein [Lacunisphaera sp.]